MAFGWIIGPLTQYILLALGLMGCLAICLATSGKTWRERRAIAKSHECLGQTVAALSAAVAEIRQDRAETESRAPAPIPGLNLTKRAQALRMHSRGETLSTIAAALQSPRNEVELLLKIQGYLNSQV